jgi:ribosomal protein S18 acetylase RimI-like enzyme
MMEAHDASRMNSVDDGLDNPVYAALRGPHRSFAHGRGRVVRYPSDVARFVGMPDAPTARDWADLQVLLEGDPGAVMLHDIGELPSSMRVLRSFEAVQMVAGDSGARSASGPASPAEVESLTRADVPDMLELVRRTEPGPFADRTAELGAYFGVKRHGTLVAMAGQRLRPAGWTELSAVCTDPGVRGQGLAGRVIAAVADEARARGDRLFLHVLVTNTAALQLYRRLGYRERRRVTIAVLT